MAGDNKMRMLKAVTLAWLCACAPDVVDIDRTQPNALKKSLFTGEWYFRPTVVEVDFNQTFVFEGLTGQMERIRWEIRKDHLVAYRSYEILVGAEEGTGDVNFNGAPVAIFGIDGHFDIQREYSASTGEQSNVIVENGSDRPWYDREYMRIDWSQNLANTSYMLEDAVEAIATHQYYSQGHIIDDPYRAEVGEKNINIVGNYALETDQWGACYGTFQDPWFCGGSDAKIRLSFRKVEGDKLTEKGNVVGDYEPMYHPDVVPVRRQDGSPVTNCDRTDVGEWECEREVLKVWERFGYFRHQRDVYDNEHQWVRDNRVFLGHRHNIWARSHDGEGNLLPPHLRPVGRAQGEDIVTPIVYYTNEDFPTDKDAWDATMAIADDWDLAFREAVLIVKQEYNPAIKLTDIPRIFNVVQNRCNIDNVNAYADANDHWAALQGVGISEVLPGNLKRACAVLEFVSDRDFTWEKFGDLRYNFFNWVDNPQGAGLLGYGPSSPDPITGEIIAANANIYGANVDMLAAYAADLGTVRT
jgi:hypothetical protein